MTAPDGRRPVSIAEAIGYDGEVSEPGGPVVRGYFTDRWAKEVTPRFMRWLARKQAKAWAEGHESGVERVLSGNYSDPEAFPNPYEAPGKDES